MIKKLDKMKYSNNRHICFILLICLVIFTFSGCGQLKDPAKEMSETQIAAYQIISDALSSDIPFEKVNAIEVVAVTGQRNFLPKVTQLLQDPYVPVRFASAIAIGDLQYKTALNMVNQLLRDNDPNVVVAASYAMYKLGYPDYIEVLKDSAQNNKSLVVKANAALLLGKSGDRNSIQLLHQLMSDPTLEDNVGSSGMVGLGYQAAEALATLGDTSIIDKIWAMQYNTYVDIRLIGIRSMGALGTPQAENALMGLLSDPVTEVRLAAAAQLGKMKNLVGENVVLDVLKNNNLNNIANIQSRELISINILTALAIGEIGTPKLTKFLPDFLKNESPFVRIAAAKAVFQTSTSF